MPHTNAKMHLQNYNKCLTHSRCEQLAFAFDETGRCAFTVFTPVIYT